MAPETGSSPITLPAPDRQGTVPLETALTARRSVRAFAPTSLSLPQVSQLLWSAQGITGPYGVRTAPSAGALYPLETLLVAGAVDGLAAGLYRYAPREHTVAAVQTEDLRPRLFAAALEQGCVANAAISIVLGAEYGRATGKYGERGQRYTIMEVGHAAQNVCLQAVTLGLASVLVGAFKDEEVKKLAQMGPDEDPLYIISVGPTV